MGSLYFLTLFEIMAKLLNYYGGKFLLSKKLINIIPRDFSRYIEPYCGSCSLFFKIMENKDRFKNFEDSVLNDLNKNLANFYNVIRDREKCKELKKQLDFTLYSREEHSVARYGSEGGLSDIERARRYFISVNCSFYGIEGETFLIKSGAANTFRNRLKVMYKHHVYLKNSYIECRPALKLIQELERTKDADSYFYYLDPPYPSSKQAYKCAGFTEYSLIELVDALKTIRGKFMLSYYDKLDCCFKFPRGWKKHYFKQSICANRGHKEQVRTKHCEKECVLVNYDIEA